MIKLFLFLASLLVSQFANADDCYPERFAFGDTTNIHIKEDCRSFNRKINVYCNLWMFLYNGNLCRVPELFITYAIGPFPKQVLDKLHTKNARYQPMSVYHKSDAYNFVLAIELENKTYKYTVLNGTQKFSPSFFSDSDKERIYPVYVDNNKLIFILTNNNSKAHHFGLKNCTKYDTYLFKSNLPLTDNKFTIEHLGYILWPCRGGGFKKNLIDFSNQELIDYVEETSRKAGAVYYSIEK